MILTSPESPVRDPLPPHVWKTRNRSGREYYYLTPHRGTARQGETILLPDDPSSPEFWIEYARLMKLPTPQVSASTVRALDRAWGGTYDKATKTDIDPRPNGRRSALRPRSSGAVTVCVLWPRGGTSRRKASSRSTCSRCATVLLTPIERKQFDALPVVHDVVVGAP